MAHSDSEKATDALRDESAGTECVVLTSGYIDMHTPTFAGPGPSETGWNGSRMTNWVPWEKISGHFLTDIPETLLEGPEIWYRSADGLRLSIHALERSSVVETDSHGSHRGVEAQQRP